ncbi:MarR family winged helix-turn-helix transcriptional regulator [Shimia biformata]|uniref:MarR family winged helix-turn-helix transcriptional regulator n=1 Tax=Shimia biformata TaxID=1294299 RepID=UPI00194EDC1D|nr:MarR family transcriptional regulator [Shimia biformata]
MQEADELEARLEKVRELESNLTFQIALVNRILENQVLDIVSGHDLNLTGYRVMRVASIFGAISLSDLSRQMLVDRAQISRTASGLEARGLIEYRQDGTNKRKKMVTLTATGRALMDELAPAFQARRQKIDDAIGEDAKPGLWQAIHNLSAMRPRD